MNVLPASLSDDITNGAATKGERIPPKEYKKCRVLNKPGPSDPQMTTRPAFPPVDKSIAGSNKCCFENCQDIVLD